MAAIYLKHPEHGTKVATSDMEAAYDRSNGWREYDPHAPVKKVPEVPEKSDAPDFLQPKLESETPSDPDPAPKAVPKSKSKPKPKVKAKAR